MKYTCWECGYDAFVIERRERGELSTWCKTCGQEYFTELALERPEHLLSRLLRALPFREQYRAGPLRDAAQDAYRYLESVKR